MHVHNHVLNYATTCINISLNGHDQKLSGRPLKRFITDISRTVKQFKTLVEKYDEKDLTIDNKTMGWFLIYQFWDPGES